MRRFSTCAVRHAMSANEHFIRSRSFSGWTHTSLGSRPTASPKKRHLGAVQLTFDVDHNALEARDLPLRTDRASACGGARSRESGETYRSATFLGRSVAALERFTPPEQPAGPPDREPRM